MALRNNDFKHTKTDDMNEPYVLYDMGLSYIKTEDFKKAVEFFQKSTECSQKFINKFIEEKHNSFEELFSLYTARFRANIAIKKANYQIYFQNQSNIFSVENSKISQTENIDLSIKTPILPLYIPAEFHQQEALRISWPQIEPLAGISNISQFIDMVKAVAPYQFVDVMINGLNQKQEAEWHLNTNNVNMKLIRFHDLPFGDHWNRDRGDTIGYSSTNECALIKCSFNAWGMGAVSPSFSEYANTESNVIDNIANQYGLPIFKSPLVVEGGALEFNGDGVLLTTKSVVMQPQRNQGWMQHEVETEFKRIFDLEKIIFLNEGLPADDSIFRGPQKNGEQGEIFYTPLTTNGHIDEVARFVDCNTILLVEVTEEEAQNGGPGSLAARTRERLENAYEILSNATNKDGKPFNIIRIPAAEEIFVKLKSGDDTFDAALDMTRVDHNHVGEPVFDEETKVNGATFVAAISYANFVITNKVVLIPKYYEPGYPEVINKKDEQVKKIFENIFPDREIVQIKDTAYIGLGGGGMHCITKHIPSISNNQSSLFAHNKKMGYHVSNKHVIDEFSSNRKIY